MPEDVAAKLLEVLMKLAQGGLMPYEGAIKEVALAVQAICHLSEVVIAAQPADLRAEQAKVQIEVLKPITHLAELVNKALGIA